MALYLGEAAKLKSPMEPVGCYLGCGGVWIETTHMTAKMKSPAVANDQRMIKLPALEVQQLLARGVERFALIGEVIEAHIQGFRARLPVTPADQFVADIKIIDHVAIDPVLVQELIQLLAIAKPFANSKAENASLRFVYAVERQVFATDGYTMFVGQLSGPLAQRMLFSHQGCTDLIRLWSNVEPAVAMQSQRSLLLKNSVLTSAVRCVDGVVPTSLYRFARSAKERVVRAQLSRSAVMDAMECYAMAADKSDLQCFLEFDRGLIRLKSCVSSNEVVIAGSDVAHHARYRLNRIHLQRCINAICGETIAFSTVNGLRSNLSLECSNSPHIALLSVMEEVS